MKNVRIILPDYFCRWEQEGWYLYFDPNNFTWVKVNKHGADIIELLRKYNNLKKVVQELSAIYNTNREEISIHVEDFVNKNLETGFLHKDHYKRLEFKDSLPEYPTALYLNVTKRCNLSCMYCFNKEDRSKVEDRYEMTCDEYLKIFKEASALGIKKVVFTGGEPLLYPGLPELAQNAREIGFNTELLTNAVMVDEDNCKQIAKVFDFITVSLDSHVKRIHENQRGSGTFEKVKNALELLRKAKAKWIAVTTVVTKNNVKDMPEYYRFALEKLQVNSVVNTICLPYVKSISTGKDSLMPSLEEITSMEKQVSRYFLNTNKKKEDQPLFRTVTCGAGTGELGVAPNGDVFPCHTLQKKEFLCGNLRKQSLKEICETSKTIKYFRELTVQKIAQCSKCDVRHICGGGCRSLAYSISGKIDGYNDLLCDYLRNKAINELWASSNFPLKNIDLLNPKDASIIKKGEGV